MRTTPPCVLESVSVMPFTVRLNIGRTAFHAISVPFEELLFTFDEEDDSDFAEDEVSALLEEDSSEELDAITELLLDSSLLLRMTSEEELLAGICDELDSASELLDSTGVELEDSTLELLDWELLESPYLE